MQIMAQEMEAPLCSFPSLTFRCCFVRHVKIKVCFNHLGDVSVSMVWSAFCSAPDPQRSSFWKFVRNLGNCFQVKGNVTHPTGTSRVVGGQVRQFQNSASALMTLFQGLLDIELPSAGKLLGQTCNSAWLCTSVLAPKCWTAGFTVLEETGSFSSQWFIISQGYHKIPSARLAAHPKLSYRA